MKIVCASDSFKGSLSSLEICQLTEAAAREAFPDVDYTGIIMADGGEGTLHAMMASHQDNVEKQLISCTVQDPLGREIQAEYGVFIQNGQKTAIIELAKASGLTLLSEAEYHPLLTSTYGTGQQILHALEHGCSHIFIGIGGSATNDGGTGAMEALGVRFLDCTGQPLHGCGKNLSKISKISLDTMSAAAKNAHFTVMCDVQNPLTGENGATFVYSAQKGADSEMQKLLEDGMKHYEALLSHLFSCDVSRISGGGAAGGVGAAFSLFLHAKLLPGAKAVLSLHNFESLIQDTDLVITGEGFLDQQTLNGKAVFTVAQYCQAASVPCCAVAGAKSDSIHAGSIPGLTEILTMKPEEMSVSESMKHARELYYDAVRHLFSDLQSIQSFVFPFSS